MYKARIHKWEMEKKTKGKEMEVIIRKQAERSRVGKKSTFRVRNRIIPSGKIERYRKEKKIGSDAEALRLRAKTPPSLACWTPPASPLTTPPELAVPERLAKLAQDWTDGSFDLSQWFDFKNNLSAGGSTWKRLEAFVFTCGDASALLRKGNIDGGLQLLDYALSDTVQLVLDSNPRLLDVMFRVLEWFSRNSSELIDIILKRFFMVFFSSLGQGHPLTNIYYHSLGLCGKDLWYNLEIMLDVQKDSFFSRLGHFHDITLHTTLTRLKLKGKRANYTIAHEYWQLLPTCDGALGVNSWGSQAVRIDFSSYLLRREENTDAAEMLQDYITMAHKHNIEVSSFTWYVAAVAQKRLSRLDLAEQYMRRAISVRGRGFGWQDPSVIFWLSTLEEWLIEWNRPEEAADLRILWLANVDFATMRLVDVSEDQ